jgi:hypothetical protein
MKLEAAAITSPHRNQSDDSNSSLVSPKAPDTATGRIQLVAPLSGRLLPIGAVPDPVFAQKMVGDRVSLDPVSQSLVSPCDGTITLIHSAGHAVTIHNSGRRRSAYAHRSRYCNAQREGIHSKSKDRRNGDAW